MRDPRSVLQPPSIPAESGTPAASCLKPQGQKPPVLPKYSQPASSLHSLLSVAYQLKPSPQRHAGIPIPAYGVALRLLQGGSGVRSSTQIGVKLPHQVSSERVVDGPKRRDHALRPGEQKGPDQACIGE